LPDPKATPVTTKESLVPLPIQLTPSVHRRLMRWCAATAAQLDVTRLARGEVIEALLEELVDNPVTSYSVQCRLAARQAAS
jgi:hypothetical protein